MGKHVTARWSRLTTFFGVALLAVVLLAGAGAAVVMGEPGSDGSPTASDTSPDDAADETPSAKPTGKTADAKADEDEKTPETDPIDALAKARERALAKARERAEALVKKRESVPPPAEFRLTSFNVLGASHTGAGGDKPGYADGVTRMGWALQLMRAQGIEVAGLQEYEPVQHNAFTRATGGGWGVYPGMALGTKGVRNSIAWNNASWEVVETHTIAIPYFRGNPVPMPYVLLEHRETGRQAWFINIHNPVSNARRGNNQHWRNVATARERDLMRSLGADGTPVFLMGDFNERNEAFCAVTAGGAAIAANGGSGGPPCSPPGNMGIDWIFGTPNVEFSGYLRHQSPEVQRTSDHPMIITNVLLDGPVSTDDD